MLIGRGINTDKYGILHVTVNFAYFFSIKLVTRACIHNETRINLSQKYFKVYRKWLSKASAKVGVDKSKWIFLYQIQSI